MRPHSRVRPLVCGAALLLAACSTGPSATPAAAVRATADFAELARQFDYDTSAPLDYRETAAADTGAASRLTELNFASPKGGRASGWPAVPTGPGPLPPIP